MLQMVGLTVISVVADGASSNRKFFRLHKVLHHQKSRVTYKAPNISSPGSFVYFMSDAPHLLKTVRKAWYNLQLKRTRILVVSTVLFSINQVNICIYSRTKDMKLNGHI